MAIEIERKFLVKNDNWRDEVSDSTVFRQGYLAAEPERSVRVRVDGARGFLTIKGKSKGATRLEFQYEVPVSEAQQMLAALCSQPIIEKTRYVIEKAGQVWELDVFHGANEGLLLAEIELQNENEHLELPDWVGVEVTSDQRYYNAYLSKHPFHTWKD